MQTAFVEIDAFAKSGEGFAEVVAGFGTVEGMPVYAFAQNSDICGGAMSKAQAAKLKKTVWSCTQDRRSCCRLL